MRARDPHMTVSTENAPPPKFAKNGNSDSLVKIQMRPIFLREFVPRDTKEFKFPVFVDIGGGVKMELSVSFDSKKKKKR